MPLLRDAQSLLPPLEEMEKNITGFYQALEKASHITSTIDSEGPVDFKQKCQVTIVYLFFLLKYLISRCAYIFNTFLDTEYYRNWRLLHIVARNV